VHKASIQFPFYIPSLMIECLFFCSALTYLCQCTVLWKTGQLLSLLANVKLYEYSKDCYYISFIFSVIYVKKTVAKAWFFRLF
jgi:hypothetical protein